MIQKKTKFRSQTAGNALVKRCGNP